MQKCFWIHQGVNAFMHHMSKYNKDKFPFNQSGSRYGQACDDKTLSGSPVLDKLSGDKFRAGGGQEKPVLFCTLASNNSSCVHGQGLPAQLPFTFQVHLKVMALTISCDWNRSKPEGHSLLVGVTRRLILGTLWVPFTPTLEGGALPPFPGSTGTRPWIAKNPVPLALIDRYLCLAFGVLTPLFACAAPPPPKAPPASGLRPNICHRRASAHQNHVRFAAGPRLEASSSPATGPRPSRWATSARSTAVRATTSHTRHCGQGTMALGGGEVEGGSPLRQPVN